MTTAAIIACGLIAGFIGAFLGAKMGGTRSRAQAALPDDNKEVVVEWEGLADNGKEAVSAALEDETLAVGAVDPVIEDLTIDEIPDGVERWFESIRTLLDDGGEQREQMKRFFDARRTEIEESLGAAKSDRSRAKKELKAAKNAKKEAEDELDEADLTREAAEAALARAKEREEEATAEIEALAASRDERVAEIEAEVAKVRTEADEANEAARTEARHLVDTHPDLTRDFPLIAERVARLGEVLHME